MPKSIIKILKMRTSQVGVNSNSKALFFYGSFTLKPESNLHLQYTGSMIIKYFQQRNDHKPKYRVDFEGLHRFRIYKTILVFFGTH
ncbi:2168ec85-918e-4be2-9b95-1658da494416-CDS [Sclerotinia trifoliorum]|uniref:2168ec85-918e-4be2-9b95-1658da494416-CDS n=1 Tax=Sclerotinia trifoliorum TaxID=28548 RepID=A0A8H2VY14_9HELO|nr:2168ec85-918e-4be2-9b95-1658da494416-CDS [Sclerotinia trifoliorum]